MDSDYSCVYFNGLFIFWVRMAGISQYIVKWEIVIPAIPPTFFFLQNWLILGLAGSIVNPSFNMIYESIISSFQTPFGMITLEEKKTMID